MIAGSLLALLAVVPLAAGTSPEAKPARMLTAGLCNGGVIRIPIGEEDGERRPCGAQACHFASCRRRFDPDQ